MPAKSKKQQQAAGIAYAAKKGEIPKSKLKGSAKDMHDSMSKKELKDYAETKHDNLPTKKENLSITEKYKIVSESVTKDDLYDRIFRMKMKKYNVTSPDQLDKEEKKKFFNEVDASWKSEKEK